MLRAVIFDFDGVITDSEVVHMRTFNEVLSQFNFQIEQADYYQNCLGFSDYDLLKKLIEQKKIPANLDDIPELIRQKNASYEQIIRKEGQVFEGVHQFLDELKSCGKRIAICSGALLSEINLILEQSGLKDYFEVIVSSEHVKRGKPYPEGFLLALEKLNKTETEKIKSSQCLVIEDSKWGLQAASKAGMHTAAITNSYGKEDLKPADIIIHNISELDIAKLDKRF
jgi:HAD superfamily hydrolase (TIGR01509 family)